MNYYAATQVEAGNWSGHVLLSRRDKSITAFASNVERSPRCRATGSLIRLRSRARNAIAMTLRRFSLGHAC